MKKYVSASILAADPLNLQSDLERIVGAGADWLHLDVMDGQYVPNITFGSDLVAKIRTTFSLTLDVHLMIKDPDKYLDVFVDAGADLVTVHPETTPHLHRTLNRIRTLGARAGVALNPGTPPSVIEYVLAEADLVLIMAVNPGFGGQSFIESTYVKIAAVAELCQRAQNVPLLAVDGGVKPDNARHLEALGIQVFVAGSSIFAADNPAAQISLIRG